MLLNVIDRRDSKRELFNEDLEGVRRWRKRICTSIATFGYVDWFIFGSDTQLVRHTHVRQAAIFVDLIKLADRHVRNVYQRTKLEIPYVDRVIQSRRFTAEENVS